MNQKSGLTPWSFLKTLLISYIVTFVLLFLLAFVMYKMKLSAAEASWAVTVIYLLSCGIGGFLTGKRMGSRRLLWGLASGALYFVVLFVFSLLTSGGLESEMKDILTVLITCLAGSAVGAVMS